MIPDDEEAAVQIIPGGGWIATYSGGSTAPVIAWALCRDGCVRPLALLDGEAERSGGWPGFDFTVSHPDETTATAAVPQTAPAT